MLIYIIVFTLTTVLGFVIDNYKKRGGKKGVNIIYLLLFFIFVALVGFRDVSVGSDSYSYLLSFELAKDLSLLEYLTVNLFSDPGFYTFTWLVQDVSGNINVYFLIITCFYFATYLKFISKYSSSSGWSVWILNSLGFTTFAMSTLRQAMAMSFCLIAYMLWVDRKKISWLFLLIACTFHLSALIYTPMMFVRSISKDRKPWKLVGIIIITMLFTPFIMNYMMSVGYIGDRYAEASNVGGIGMIIMLLVFVVIGLFTYYPKRRDIPDTYYYELVAVGFALCSFLVTRFNMAAMRLFWYFLSFTMIFVPNVLSKMKPYYKVIWSVGIAIITFYYLFFRVMDSPYDEGRLLLPYKFFWE